MDEIRRRISERMQEVGLSGSELSRTLRRNRSYVFQYLHHGTPRDLPYELKLKVAEVLDMPMRDLGIAEVATVLDREMRLGGMSEDAEIYEPDKSDFFVARPHIGHFRMKSLALDQHERRLLPGDRLIFDLNQVDTAKIPTGSIVIVALFDKRDLTISHGTLVREFIAPNKLITNSSAHNEIFSLDDPLLPWEAVIRGVLRSVIRDVD